MADAPKPPSSLDTAGRAMWRALSRDLELEPYELVILTNACALQDTITRLQEALSKTDTFVEGYSKQPVLNGAFQELRLQRQAQSQLLRQLGFPTGEEEELPGQRSRSTAARELAKQRWAR